MKSGIPSSQAHVALNIIDNGIGINEIKLASSLSLGILAMNEGIQSIGVTI